MASFYLKMCFHKTAYQENKNIQGKMNRKSNNKQFFSEELLQEIFSNLQVGQYNLLSHFTTKEKNLYRKDNYCCVWAAFLNELIFYEKFPDYILTSMTTYQIYFGDTVGVPNLIKLT